MPAYTTLRSKDMDGILTGVVEWKFYKDTYCSIALGISRPSQNTERFNGMRDVP